MRSYRW